MDTQIIVAIISAFGVIFAATIGYFATRDKMHQKQRDADKEKEKHIRVIRHKMDRARLEKDTKHDELTCQIATHLIDGNHLDVLQCKKKDAQEATKDFWTAYDELFDELLEQEGERK